ncbi:MAG TPA: UDP-glucose 4-epimerase GalE [Clostridiales bacterium]|nr:UDP-glucose 4-epimerase GalE [Clostridiales bacterium]
MTVLLTGGAGYIGSHTALELIQAGYHVIIADNLSNSGPAVIERIEKISGTSVPFFNIDISQPEAVDRLFRDSRIDSVIHFAGYKAVGESSLNPLKYYRNNLDCTLTLLEAMETHRINKIVFSSSATVYGYPEKSPVEEDAPTCCENPYGWSKLMIEQIITDYAKANPSVSAILLRYFNPIGAHESGLIGEDPAGIPNNLMPYISQVAIGRLEKLRVFGGDYPTKDGTGVRDYIHVTDLAKGHVAALKYAEKHTGLEIFNLGTGVGSSVLDIISAFERATGVKIPYEIVDRRPGDVAEYYANPKKAEKLLGWKAEKSLEDACRDTWNWQLKNPYGYKGSPR